jgi:K+-transporting ATPase KdpF subunit
MIPKPPISLFETLELLWQGNHKKIPLFLFFALCLNLILAPTVLAAAGNTISRGTAYAIGLLGLVVLGLTIYLFTVILQPERF